MRRRPLSTDQERMWLVEQLAPGALEEPALARLTGPLSPAAFTDALNEVVARHDSLRTTFPIEDGVPYQLIGDYAPSRPRLVDLAGLTIDPGVIVDRLVAAESTRAFDLPDGPLSRVTLIRLSRDDHVLIIAVHHLIADLWSMTVLVREISAGYRAHVSGVPTCLPEVSLQPADLAERAGARLTAARLARLRGLWRERLAGVRPVALPADHPRSAVPNLRSRGIGTQLDQRLSDDLRRASTAESVTLFVTLLAGVQALIARWAGHDDLVVVSVAAGRRGRDAERVIGMLTECLVIRLDAGADPTLRELLHRARDGVFDAMDGVDLPFAEIVAILDPARDLEPSPLRQIGLSMHNIPASAPELAGLTFAPLRPPGSTEHIGVSEADLWLEVFDDGRGPLRLRLQLDDRMFEPATLPVVVKLFITVLAAIAADTGTRLSQLIVPAERAGLPHGSVDGAAVNGVTVNGVAVDGVAVDGDADAGQPPAADTPAPATVQAVAGLVRALLNVDDVRAEHNVFRLGATSMDASRLASRIERLLRVRLDLYEIMTARTIGAIANAVEGAVYTAVDGAIEKTRHSLQTGTFGT